MPGAADMMIRTRTAGCMAGLRSGCWTGLPAGADTGAGKACSTHNANEESAVSRVLSRAIIHLGLPSPAASSDLPGSPGEHRCTGNSQCMLPYLVLLRAGFTVPRRVTTRAVRSYRTFSPLPAPFPVPAVCFLWHFPWARAPQALPGALFSRSPDFPPATASAAAGDCLADSTGKSMTISHFLASGPAGTQRPGVRR